MDRLVVTAVGTVLAAHLSVVGFHRGLVVGTRVLGRDRCLPAESAVGCAPWILGTALSAAAVAALRARIGWFALLAVPVGPMMLVVAVSFQLRLRARAHRRTAFRIKEGRLVALDGSELRASCVLAGGDVACTGPASGYVVYSLTLHDGRRTLNDRPGS